MANHDPEAFEAAARAIGFKGFGFYPRSGFMHIDLGSARSWGERFPKRATAFAAETPPAREVLSESRTLKGGGAAGVATVGAAGVEVAQQVLAETQGAVLPLVPYSTPCGGCLSRWRSAASRWRSMPGSTIGSKAGGDRRRSRLARRWAARASRLHRAHPRNRPPAPHRPPMTGDPPGCCPVRNAFCNGSLLRKPDMMAGFYRGGRNGRHQGRQANLRQPKRQRKQNSW